MEEARKQRKLNGWAVLAAIVTIVYSLPILWLVMTSFKSRIDIFAVPPKFIFKPTLANYVYTIKRGLFWGPLLNSVIMSVASVLLAVALTLFAAYAISRFNISGSPVIMFMVLSLRMMPAPVVVIPMFLLYRILGLVNNYIGMILLYAMFSIPFSLWMLKGFIDEVPKQFDDAALADGASVPRVLRDVILPQLGPALATVMIFNMIFVWNEFLFSYILTGVETRTIPVQIALGIYTDKGVDWEYVSALSTIYIVPIVIAVFALQKSLLRGMTFGTIRR